MSESNSVQPLGSYSPQDYATDGGFTVSGLALSTFSGVAVALTVGVLFGVIGQFFYVVLAFPVLIGLAVGGIQVFAIKKTKIRSTLACGAAGLVAGAIAVISMHYVDYVVFSGNMSINGDDEFQLRKTLAETEDEEGRAIISQMLSEYQNDPEVIDAKNVTTFVGYVDYSARHGVELSSARPSSGTPVNLGYAGTYVYWGVEALIIAGIAVAMARKTSAEPFCLHCDEWRVEREMGSIQSNSKTVSQILSSGRLDDLQKLTHSPNDESVISVFECPCCENQSEVVVQVSGITYNNGNRVKTEAGRFVYPAGVVEQLTEFFVGNDEVPTYDDLDPEIAKKLMAAANT